MSPWKIYFLLVFLNIQYDDSVVYQYEPPDQDQYLDHGVHGPKPVNNRQQLKMADIQPNQGSTIDPKAPLSSADLARLLMQYCSDRLKEERCFTKELINDKAEVVITGVVKGMREGLALMTETIN